MKRRTVISLGILAALLLALFGAAWAVLASESGLRWLLARVAAAVPGQLAFGTVHGTLGGPIQMDNVTYADDGIELRIGRIALSWNPWALLAHTVAIDQLLVDDVNYVSTRPPDDSPIRLPEVSTPVTVGVGALRVGKVTMQTARDAAPFTLESIDAALELSGSTLDAGHLDVRAAQFAVRVAGTLELRGDYTAALTTQWSVTRPQVSARGQGEVRGDTKRVQLDQTLEAPLALPVRLTLFDLLTAPRFEVHAATPALDLRGLVPDWPLPPGDVTLDAQGDVKRVHAQLRWRGTHDISGAFELRTSVAFADRRLDIAALDVALVDSDTRVSGAGHVVFDPEAAHGIAAMQAQVQWQQLRWPLRGAPVVGSAHGRARVEGVPANYALTLDANLAGADVPPGEWSIAAQGDTQRLTISTALVKTLDGELRVDGAVQWDPALEWKLNATAQRLNPAQHWPQWPGRVAAQLTADGAVTDGRVTTRIDLAKLDGRVRDYPVRARLRGQLDGDAVQVQLAEFRSGAAIMTLRGSVDQAWAVDASINAPQASALHPEARGALHAELRVRGPREQPLVQFSANAEQLAWQRHTVARVDIDGALDFNTAQPSRLDITAKQGVVAGRPVDTLAVRGTGSLAEHRVTLELAAAEVRAALEAAGAWRTERWTASLTRADVTAPRFGAWSLTQPAAMLADTAQARIERACLSGGDHGASCVQAQWNAGKMISAQASIERIPATLLHPGDRQIFDIAGVVSGNVRVQYELAPVHAPFGAVLSLQLSPGEMRLSAGGDDTVQFQHNGARLTASVDAQGARGRLDLDAGALGRAVTSVQLPGWTPQRAAHDQPLDGLVQAELNDPGFVAHLVTALEKVRGQVQVDASLAGTLAAPQVRGHASLTGGAAALPGIGIALTSIRIDAHNSADDRIAFSARAQSGPGFVEVKGDVILDRAAGWPVYAEIRGDRFEAVNLPESYVLASPDLQLQVGRNRIDLNGVLTIPEARYVARDISEAVTASGDVVIKGKDEAAPREGKWQIYSAVRFVLGEKVTFNGFGLKGKVRGEVVAIEEPKKLTTGYGELQLVDATFNAYKIELAVTRGRLTFAGGPINNPGIDARAVREAGAIRQAAAKDAKVVEREPGGILVGAQVRGTLRKFEITLFSDPPRDQADVLSLLLFGVPLGEATTEEGKALFIAASTLRLTGRDDTMRKIGSRFGIEEIRLETGSTPEQAALVLGRYFGPRLYVNYIVSASSNVWRVRYRISSKWTLQSEQSDVESAADLLYTFEH